MSIGAPAERIVDRAAAHATPAQLAVRDRLLVALAFSSGIYEAICFLSFGKIFTGFQTGNIVFLGLGAVGTRPPYGPNPVSAVTSLVAFLAGAAVAVRILKAFDGDEEVEVEDSDVFEVWPRRVSITLGAALVVQVGFLAVWMAASPSSTNILIGLNAFAMGMQMNAIRSLHVPAISTTAETATIISWISSIASWSLKGPAARRLTGVVVALAVGALVGDWLLDHLHSYAPVLPALVMALVIAIASVALKQKPPIVASDNNLENPEI